VSMLKNFLTIVKEFPHVVSIRVILWCGMYDFL
jgi:hypothetical protein